MAASFRPSLRTAALTVTGAGFAYQGYRYCNNGIPFVKEVYAETPAGAKKMDWKGFTELKLESAEMYNHNVKKLTFALPDDQTVSGLSPISKSYQ
jgi:hypothetical protein